MKKKKPHAPQTTHFPRIASLNRYLEENLAIRILKWVLMAGLLAGGTALMVATAGEPPALLAPRAMPLPPLPAPPQPSLFSKLLGNAASTSDTTQHPGWSYVYDENDSLIAEIGTGGPNSSDTIRHIYLPTPNGPMPIVTVVNGKRYAVSSDHLNTPRRLTDDQGRVVWQRAYSAFDDEPPTTIDNRFANLALTPNPGKTNVIAPKYNIRGQNHYADEESGLVYNGARSLVPGLNRYLQADRSGLDGGLNRFVHVENDALGMYDPDGYDPARPYAKPPTPPITAPITAGGAGRMLIPGGMPRLAAPVPVCPPLVANSKGASESLGAMKGMGAAERDAALSGAGYAKTKISNSAAKNETWTHADGSEVRVHPYGNQNASPYKSGNNAHLHKQDSAGGQLNDRGQVSTNPNDTHIGLPNPSDFPSLRGRPNGS